MKVLILGVDGYLGWSLALWLANQGIKVGGCDNFNRRKWVQEVGGQSVTPIRPMSERLKSFKKRFGFDLKFYSGDLTEYGFTESVIRDFSPDSIIHLAEQPSAPFSMMNVDHAVLTQKNNVINTLNLLFAVKMVCPEVPIVKLGTMGEYGTPGIEIPEGFFDIEYRGRKATLPFPKQPGSFYHLTKVHDSNNIYFACKIWGLKVTDIMQGVVYGTTLDVMENDETLFTRFDSDGCFGTAINRYCAQAVLEHPLTPYGAGHQRRGFLPLQDSMTCLTLALMNPPDNGSYRVFNQLEDIYDITELALLIQEVASDFGIDVKVRNTENPRIEAEDHFYKAERKHLVDLGYVPTTNMKDVLRTMFPVLIKYKDRIQERVMLPKVHWDGRIQGVRYLK